ncbi:MAG: hypothetical protein CVU50_01060 [Candidatus Cloacimonetes bacterium HGW-Cloacimonetes-3]|jgi:hypothetical protein|nr:MAG: hypothetical protein CVU50_01060 [Candidatus Cloacimonetes bacterium HGW-Cloacimonetes-3]
MKRLILIIYVLVSAVLWSVSIPADVAQHLASVKVQQLYPSLTIGSCEMLISPPNELLAYVYHLKPTGYIIIGAKEELPPLYAYSGSSDYVSLEFGNPLADIAIADLNYRLQSDDEAARNREAWQSAFYTDRIEQWPPAGYSLTEGWVKTLWTQSFPFNMMCPLDTVTGNRSVAGCPAIAMGQIVKYHHTLNGTRLNDADDYYHSYSGRNYWVDNDFATVGFPSYPQLNGYLDEINNRFRYQQDLNDSLDAAIVFAVGSALKQVYSSLGSGTFAVSQAYNAFLRFGFSDAELLTETSPDLYPRMVQNIKNGLPVHFAVVTPAWDSGHNVVVDGYNANNYFHLNFGWGGANNGWLLLPQQMPYNLTVVEGAVVDVKPIEYVLAVPDTLNFSYDSNQVLEIYNMHNDTIIVEALLIGSGLEGANIIMLPQIPLPASIPANGMMSFSINFNNTAQLPNLEGNLRLILNNSAVNIPVRYANASALDDESAVPALGAVSVYPNPFCQSCKIKLESKNEHKLKLEVFNIKGQKLYSDELMPGAQPQEFIWKGNDSMGNPVPSGIYLYRLSGATRSISGKLLKLR